MWVHSLFWKIKHAWSFKDNLNVVSNLELSLFHCRVNMHLLKNHVSRLVMWKAMKLFLIGCRPSLVYKVLLSVPQTMHEMFATFRCVHLTIRAWFGSNNLKANATRLALLCCVLYPHLRSRGFLWKIFQCGGKSRSFTKLFSISEMLFVSRLLPQGQIVPISSSTVLSWQHASFWTEILVQCTLALCSHP